MLFVVLMAGLGAMVLQVSRFGMSLTPTALTSHPVAVSGLQARLRHRQRYTSSHVASLRDIDAAN